jgi:ABC-type spermidine/putrescine transport system permease subunit II
MLDRVMTGRFVDRLGRSAVGAFVALCVAFLLAPAVLTMVLSFSNGTVIHFPPDSWGLRQYRQVLTTDVWYPVIRRSLEIASLSALLAIAVGVPAALAISRTRLPGRFAVEVGGLAGVVLPISAYAVAMYAVYAQFHLLARFGGLVIADAVLGLPFVLVVCTSALSRIPLELDRVAMTLGASRLRAWVGITLRLLLPAIASGGLLAFIASFDEAVLINFLGGPGLVTLPKAIFDSVRYGVDPAITAISAMFIVTTGVVLVSVSLIQRMRR